MKTITYWPFTSNLYLVRTKTSYKLMEMISADHEAKLLGQISTPRIAPLITFFSPFRTAYATAYYEWKYTRDLYGGKTLKLYRLRGELSSEKIAAWDVRIQVVFPEGTEEYGTILPEGRAPFQQGGIDDRIANVARLLLHLGNYPALIQVKNDVQLFYTELNNTRKKQQGLEGELKKKSMTVEDQRMLVGHALFKSTADLMSIFYTEPWKLEMFFDLEIIQQKSGGDGSPPDPVVTLTLNPGATVESGLIIEAETKVIVRNNGNSTLRLCMSNESGVPCDGDDTIFLSPNSEMEISPAMLDKPEGGLLNITNVSNSVSGEVEIWYAE